MLNQGTGIGLCLSKHLTNLMKGDLWLDEDYDSGVEGFPGTRFILDLHVPPLDDAYWEDADGCIGCCDDSRRLIDQDSLQIEMRDIETDHECDKFNVDTESELVAEAGSSAAVMPLGPDKHELSSTPDVSGPSKRPVQQHKKVHKHQQDLHQHVQGTGALRELPTNLRVLFVDDDLVLRKLFLRSLKKIAPTWELHEAANGETAIHMVDKDQYDVIFLDQYMSSIDKQMLGTETARAMRAHGVKSRICGLSANDTEQAFLDCGADCFLFKPFPCEKGALSRALFGVLYGPFKRPHENLHPVVPIPADRLVAATMEASTAA